MPNWVFGAGALALLAMAAAITEAVRRHREQRLLHAIFDGRRIEHERAWYAIEHQKFHGVTFEVHEKERRFF